MVIPNCPRCDNTTFRLQLIKPAGSDCKLYVVVCASCGVVVGTHEYSNPSTRIRRIEAILKQIAQAVEVPGKPS